MMFFHSIRDSKLYQILFGQFGLFALFCNQGAECFQSCFKNLSHQIVDFSNYLYGTPYLLMNMVQNICLYISLLLQ